MCVKSTSKNSLKFYMANIKSNPSGKSSGWSLSLMFAGGGNPLLAGFIPFSTSNQGLNPSFLSS